MLKKEEKREKEERIREYIYVEDFEGSLVDVKTELVDLEKEFSSYNNLRFVYNVGAGYECDAYLSLVGTRLETDEEFEFRLVEEQRQRELVEEQERLADEARAIAELEKEAAAKKKAIKDYKRYLKLKERFEKDGTL